MNSKAKPFVKWVGGKGQLIEQLEQKLPADFDNWENATYIEPFVGGGAMLFYMLQQHPNIKRAVINDAENGGYPPTQNGDIRSLFWLFSLMALQN